MSARKDTRDGATAKAPDHEPCPQTSDGPPPRPSDKGGLARLRERFGAGRKFERPVAWLLGRQLLRSMKGVLLYAAYGKKLDPRDWMQASVVSFSPGADDGKTVDAAWRERGGFWFDYISDTGDGMRATYSLAYLCMSDLYVPTRDPGSLAAGEEVGKDAAGGYEALPRGQFLFVGGDTAYHASDYITLANRIQLPFKWAHEDLLRDGRIGADEPPRPLFGIPGNHDYYDQLDGFRRQFRRPVLREPRPPGAAPPATAAAGEPPAQLIVPGFYRAQESSYVALRLPFGWWFWGLDTEVGQIDDRQKKFFRQFCPEVRDDLAVPPERLIVATCSPTTVFGKLADPEDFKAADAFGQLGIEQPFLPEDVDASRRDDGTYDLSTSGDARLRAGRLRLDLSGDVHHYARYWGPPPPPCSVEPRGASATRKPEGPRADAPVAYRYASVVSGIGGAFHHPSQTYLNEVREQSLYPSEEKSTEEVSGRLFKFWNIWGGGYIWLGGVILTFLLYFALTVPQSTRQSVNNLPHFGLGLATSQRINPTAVRVPEGASRDAVLNARFGEVLAGKEVVTPFWHKVLGVGEREWRPDAPPCSPGEPRYFFGPCRVEAPADFWVGLGMALVASLPLLLAALRKKLYEGEARADRQAEKTAGAAGSPGADALPSSLVDTPAGNKIRPAKVDPERFGKPDRKLWALTALAALLFFLGLATVKPYRSHITPFGNSLLVLLTLVWAGACVAVAVRYSEFLFKKSHEYTIEWYHYTLPWVLSVLALVSVSLGLWSFGRNNLPALLVSDMLFVAVMAGTLIGLILLPFLGGTHLLAKKPGAVRHAGRFLIGLWHFVLQIAVPFVLVRKGSLLTLAGAALLILFGTWAGEKLLKKYSGAWLALAWVVLGAAVLVLPFVTSARAVVGLSDSELWGTLTRQPFATGDWTGWAGLVPSAVAAAVGAITCCFWFGWYLGVCFAFNGHNNEAGGAARIERFKQFVRFRLTDEGLTGYVIGLNDPSEDGRELRPHVVDVFHLGLRQPTR